MPRQAVPYILLQRLEVQILGSRLHYSRAWRSAYPLYERSHTLRQLYWAYSTLLEPRLRARKIAAMYSGIMAREFSIIRPYLPDRLDKVLGIGPGVAGLEAHLSSYLAGLGQSRPDILLLDKSELGDVFYGYHDQPAAYNSLKVARELLVDNGHPADKIALIDASAFDPVNLPKLDLVTSLIAWGFHFPVATYLEAVHTSLHDEGVLILDARKDTGGREVLQNRFRTVTTILDDLKFERIVARK